MRACGLIVEYNPFHNGHAHHIQAAKDIAAPDCIIAVMSGNFLQRGEPAIMDKFHRAKAALAAGADLVIELPFPFAVQNSDYFGYGAVQTLNAIGVSSICFGSESGEIAPFINSYEKLQANQENYKIELKEQLHRGISFPKANMHAFQAIGLNDAHFDLSQPNNMLGFSYVKAILDDQLPIKPLTIKRHQSHYHDPEITNRIASATSIRKEIFQMNELSSKVTVTMPETTIRQLLAYKDAAETWHDWEHYFQILNYRIQTMTHEELQEIHGMDEGLEFRVKKTAKSVQTMQEWITAIKTKRYTWTRVQRMFVHVLTNTKKKDIETIRAARKKIPYVRLLGMTKQGQKYLNTRKKQIDTPIITAISKHMDPMLYMEEKAANVYYSILHPESRKRLQKQELTGPILHN